MGQKIKKLKKIRLHREGTDQLVGGAIALVAIAAILWGAFDTKIPFWIFLVVFGVVYCIVLNFYRCPIRYLNVEDTEKLVVAPADGKIVVIEEVDNAPYFNDKRLMISIFMSLWNVHANWFPVDGKVKFVKHVDGNYHKAWLPKASEENEHADVMITTPEGVDVLCRQIAVQPRLLQPRQLVPPQPLGSPQLQPPHPPHPQLGRGAWCHTPHYSLHSSL